MPHIQTVAERRQSSELRAALLALETLLERRVAQLCEEVAHYPTPIAHCDDQLPHLIEQRGVRLSQLRAVQAIVRETDGNAEPSLEAIEQLVGGYGRMDDDEERALVRALDGAARGVRDATRGDQNSIASRST